MSCVWCVQLEDRIAELQAGIAAALQGQREAQQRTSDHKLQLDSLRDSQTSLQVSVREERERRERRERGERGERERRELVVSTARMRFRSTSSCYRRKNSS